MNKKLAFLGAGLALMVGLYLYDRDNRTEIIFSALVTAIDARDNEAGPDSWHVTIIGPDGPTELEPLQTRPNLELQQLTCVTRITRMGQPDEFRWSPSASC